MNDKKLIALLDHFAGIALNCFIDASRNEYLEYVDDTRSDNNPHLSLHDIADSWAIDAYVVAESMVMHRQRALENLKKTMEPNPSNVNELNINIRTKAHLILAGIFDIDELIQRTEVELMRTQGLDIASVLEIKESLEEQCCRYLKNDPVLTRKTAGGEEGRAE